MKSESSEKRRLSLAAAALGGSSVLYLPAAIVYIGITGCGAANMSPWSSSYRTACWNFEQAHGVNPVGWVENMDGAVLMFYFVFAFPLLLLLALLLEAYIHAEILNMPIKRDAAVWVALAGVFLPYPLLYLLMMILGPHVDIYWFFSGIMAVSSFAFGVCQIRTLVRCVRRGSICLIDRSVLPKLCP